MLQGGIYPYSPYYPYYYYPPIIPAKGLLPPYPNMANGESLPKLANNSAGGAPYS